MVSVDIGCGEPLYSQAKSSKRIGVAASNWRARAGGRARRNSDNKSRILFAYFNTRKLRGERESRRKAMGHLTALIFDDQFKGGEARAILHRMAGEQLLKIDDTVVIRKDLEGQTEILQDDKSTKMNPKEGHVLGLLAAAITGSMPLTLAGAVAGRLMRRLMDHGITHKFVKDLKQELKPGTSALILLGQDDPRGRAQIMDRLKGFEPEILESDMPPDLQAEIEKETRGQSAA